MDLKQAIGSSFAQADMVVDAYLEDLQPEELLVRPIPGANHIAWQLGHLIAAERYLIDKVAPGKLEPLPEGFDQAHKKATAARRFRGVFRGVHWPVGFVMLIGGCPHMAAPTFPRL